MKRKRPSREELERAYAALGVDEDGAVAAELDEGSPQLAVAALLLSVWRSVDGWRDDLSWVDRMADGPHGPRDPRVRDVVRRILAAGVTAEELGLLARDVAASASFHFADTLDDGYAAGLQEAYNVTLPGWELHEVGPDGKGTGRSMDFLHESLFGWEPGRVARPEPEWFTEMRAEYAVEEERDER